MIINSFTIIDEVFNYFAADPIGPFLNLDRVADKLNNPISHKITDQFALFDQFVIDNVKADRQFQFFCSKVSDADIDRQARLWLLKKLLLEGIPEARLKVLIDSVQMKKPPPYDNPAVADLILDSDYMVPLSSFQIIASALVRGDVGFTIMLPIQSSNSQYWLTKSLLKEGLQNVTSVRLDPFLVQQAKDYEYMEYKMWWYGKPLDWKRIDGLKIEEHGRWAPGKFSVRSAYTDYAWTPRDDEIHFRCEEIPAEEELQTRGSRYFHAIYSPVRKRIIHLDGAIRIYNIDEWQSRRSSHVRVSGKVGKRFKIFRVDADIDPDCMGSVCSNFFIWNNDVARYFGADIPEGF